MCGFVGQLSSSGADPQRLLRGLDFLQRRGPDSQRLWVGPDRNVSLLHARLAIVDKDPAAHQPLTDTSGGVTVAFVGEVYNHLQLRRRFADYAYRTGSDTETILAAYAALGEQAFALLKGMFAIALADTARGKLYLLRDAIGKKPLYLCRWGDRTYFGTNLLACVAAHGQAPSLLPQQIRSYWAQGYVDPRGSLLAGAEQVAPGTLLRLDASGRIEHRMRVRPAAGRLYDGETYEESVRITGELLDAAVRARLQDNPSPTLLLSGGIDSTVVTRAAAAAVGPTRLRVLTFGSFPPGSGDEPYAAQAARRIGVRPIRIWPDRSDLDRLTREALRLQDEPLGMPSFIMLTALVRQCASHSRILLSGDGGDETFLGYDRTSEWAGGPAASEPPLSGPDLPDWLSTWGRRAVSEDLVGHNFQKIDRATAEQGVEMRCPLLDWDLVCYARSLPREILLRGGVSKALLKAQLADWPPVFVSRPKIGAQFRLRWLWLLSGYHGLRAEISDAPLAALQDLVPAALAGPPARWHTWAIHRHFTDAWKIAALSAFMRKLSGVTGGGP